ncbi:MAG: Ig-like domain-containing protein, partial [Oscillospiraceae bacterium]|nr:Ig-like domain-containing protein [Oscillospiraceae bacterium]
MKKKLVSFLLAFCMLLGMIPSDFVSADASGAVSVEYVFRGAGADKASDKVSATTISNYNLSDSGNWSWYGKTWTAANAEATMRDFGGTDKDYLNVANTQSDEWFALDIKAPESAGEYAVEFYYMPLKNSNVGACDIYFVEKPNGGFNEQAVNTALENSSPIGNINFKKEGATGDTAAHKPLNNIDFKQGKSYLLVFKTTTASRLLIKSIKIAKMGELTELIVSPETARIPIGGTESITVSGKDSNGTALQAGAFDEISYASSNEAVAMVSNGVITGVATGTATITVTATLGN